MRKSKFSPDQIVRMLREAEQLRAAGKTVAEVCQGFGVSDQTYHHWKAKYGGMDAKKRAVVAVTRNLAVPLLSLAKSGEHYDPMSLNSLL